MEIKPEITYMRESSILENADYVKPGIKKIAKVFFFIGLEVKNSDYYFIEKYGILVQKTRGMTEKIFKSKIEEAEQKGINFFNKFPKTGIKEVSVYSHEPNPDYFTDKDWEEILREAWKKAFLFKIQVEYDKVIQILSDDYCNIKQINFFTIH